MSSHHCYICASDEGILLDIFADGGKTHCGKIETCLSVKIEKRNGTSTKICHKCAYELDACSKFVQKFRETRDVRKVQNKRSKGRCSLCYEPGKKGYIFELGEGTPLNNSLRKIRELFNDNFFKDEPASLSICLNCRYNLDVLFDLKSIYRTTLDKSKDGNEEITKTSEYPKTRTSVVNRKTTYIPLPQLNGNKVNATESGNSIAMPMRRKRGRPRKDSVARFRICEQCDSSVESAIDMYRYHRTGRTVCKDCWLTMDTEKIANNKRRKLGLVLKDVLSNPSKYKNVYKVERDEHGNTTFLITDDSSESEEKERTPIKRTPKLRGNVKSPIEETATTTLPEKKKPVKRVVSGKSSTNEYEPPAKVAIKGKTKRQIDPSTSTGTKTRSGIYTSDSEVIVTRTRSNSVASSENIGKAASLSDVESRKLVSKKKSKPRNISIVVTPESPTKIAITARGRRATPKVAATIEKIEQAARPGRRTRANSLTSQASTSLTSRPTSLSQHNSKSLSESGLPVSKRGNSKTKSLSPKNARSNTEPELPYNCAVCKVGYKNKLIGMAHELTHAKQPEVKLQRVTIPEVIVEEATTDVSLIEEPEEQSHDVSSTSDHRSENVESGETAAVEAPLDTVDRNIDVGLEKTEECERVPILEEEIAVEVVNEDKDRDNEKDDKENEEEEQTDAPVAQESESIEENKKVDDGNVKNVEDVETNETSIIPDSDKNNDDKVTKETPVKEKPESAAREVTGTTEKEVESRESIEKPAEEEESLKESSPDVESTPVKAANGVDADAETNEIEKVEKSAAELDIETDFRIVDACGSEESLEPENIPTVTSETPKKDNKDANPEKDDDKTAPTEQTDNKSLESTLETARREVSKVEEDAEPIVGKESESISVVTEVLREVFDLATAEVQKRLDTERPNDEKCTTPIPETLENISREIQNSADMPSLEPLTEDQTGNDKSSN